MSDIESRRTASSDRLIRASTANDVGVPAAIVLATTTGTSIVATAWMITGVPTAGPAWMSIAPLTALLVASVVGKRTSDRSSTARERKTTIVCIIAAVMLSLTALVVAIELPPPPGALVMGSVSAAELIATGWLVSGLIRGRHDVT